MILVLGGTSQGRIACECLDSAGKKFYYSTKGNLQNIKLCNGIHISGAMDYDGMCNFCTYHNIKLIVDAAHPFAIGAHKTIYQFAKQLDIVVIRLERFFAKRDPNIIWCNSYAQAIEKLNKENITKLLALTGVNTIPTLKAYWQNNKDCKFRVLDREDSITLATNNGFLKKNLLYFKESLLTNDSGKTDAEFLEDLYTKEYQLFKELKPQAIITKESGDSGYFNQKVKAAQDLGIKVFAIERPSLPKEFITVYGPIGLRREIEKRLDDFFSLKIGYTSGTYACAATKAAMQCILNNTDANTNVLKNIKNVFISLPSNEQIEIAIDNVKLLEQTSLKQSAIASVIKESGDDPDVTNSCVISSLVELVNQKDTSKSPSPCLDINFLQGEGVGKVSLPGLGLEIGEPAINKTPRKMIYKELSELLPNNSNKVNVTISVKDGAELAKRTFNPKLGVVGGISIIGTSGVIKPFSREAFLDSIKKEIEVAIAVGGNILVINSGAKSEQAVKKIVNTQRELMKLQALAEQSFIHYGNFIGETIKLANSLGIKELIMGIMIGKAVKLAEGFLDTHSKLATMNKSFVKSIALNANCSQQAIDAIDNINMANQIYKELNTTDLNKFKEELVKLCYNNCKPLFSNGKLRIIIIE